MKPKIFKQKPSGLTVNRSVDAYNSTLRELFFLDYPGIKIQNSEYESLFQSWKTKTIVPKIWLYYPSKKTLIATVGENEFFKLRTARNKNLITSKEQISYRNLSVGIAGLSVGSSILSALVISGGPRNIKLADFDSLELTNLNRIQASLLDIGRPKHEIAAERVWESDPFAKLQLFSQGINKKNINKFFLGTPRLNVFIDEMDNIEMKLHSRIMARKYKIPVLMATDNGDTVTLDVERFDQEPKRKLFHGVVGDIEKLNFNKFSYQEWLALATRIVGHKHLTPKMRLSLRSIGKNIAAVPQLGTTAMMAGSSVSLALRKIANNEKLTSGRYVISLEKHFIASKKLPTKPNKFKHTIKI